MIIHTKENLSYLPQPNTCNILSTKEISPLDKTSATFVIILDKQSFWLARNRRRGIEIAGGHIEHDESFIEAVTREAMEETGIQIEDIHPFLMQKMEILEGSIIPENYKYPYPLSYMQYWIASMKEKYDYCENDECLNPVQIKIVKDQLEFNTHQDKEDFLSALEKSSIFYNIIKYLLFNKFNHILTY